MKTKGGKRDGAQERLRRQRGLTWLEMQTPSLQAHSPFFAYAQSACATHDASGRASAFFSWAQAQVTPPVHAWQNRTEQNRTAGGRRDRSDAKTKEPMCQRTSLALVL